MCLHLHRKFSFYILAFVNEVMVWVGRQGCIQVLPPPAALQQGNQAAIGHAPGDRSRSRAQLWAQQRQGCGELGADPTVAWLGQELAVPVQELWGW